jgi:hypothetical protein
LHNRTPPRRHTPASPPFFLPASTASTWPSDKIYDRPTSGHGSRSLVTPCPLRSKFIEIPCIPLNTPLHVDSDLDPSALKNLDSNIKKNTGFIKKCKTGLTADVSAQLLNDIKKLSLEKYISEIVAAILEGLSRCKLGPDVAAAVEVRAVLPAGLY